MMRFSVVLESIFFCLLQFMNSPGVRPDKLSGSRVGERPTCEPKGMGAGTDSCVLIRKGGCEA
jgi:hypothetical protein